MFTIKYSFSLSDYLKIPSFISILYMQIILDYFILDEPILFITLFFIQPTFNCYEYLFE